MDVLNSNLPNANIPQNVPPQKIISPVNPPIYFQPPRYTLHTFGLPNIPAMKPLSPLPNLQPIPSIIIQHKKIHHPKIKREEFGGLTVGQLSLPNISSESSSVDFQFASSAKR